MFETSTENNETTFVRFLFKESAGDRNYLLMVDNTIIDNNLVSWNTLEFSLRNIAVYFLFSLCKRNFQKFC